MRHRSIALIVVTALLAAGCTAQIPGTPRAAKVVKKEASTTTVQVRGSDNGPIDKLAATALTDIEEFWTESFQTTFNKPWKPLGGGYFSVDTADATAKPPPCTQKAADVEGNAFYCPAADAIAWDRASLLPVLQDRFGEAAVVVVLAHEIGHAVQNRMGITPEAERREPERYPTILTEAQADCFAGAFVRNVTDGKSQRLDINADALDKALGALITFRDPVGTSPEDEQAHGSAFDRVAAFQDGYEQGTKFCGAMTVQNRQFTQRAFTSVKDRANGGNLPFDDMLEAVTPDLDGFFKNLATTAGKTWPSPRAEASQTEPTCSGDQGPVAYCPADKTIKIDTKDELPALHREFGDYATGTLIATRYAMAELAVLGKPTEGEGASAAALCLAGAYTGEVFKRQDGFGLSPGDFDEAVTVLLQFDYAARDTKGSNPVDPGFERVAKFREGVFEGAKKCGV
ncbi:neutral zinc metallopeptidase [Lentzea sp. BCCO 10_0798]|uniref:Neutral zinc metallopeptidase n=1 Tax=Lentzea kristufekii TaxID=3095430 RepID=A0ABU4U5P8_9PSEU|nr:neutral zinc metallopeptidase [Lentzea sp. BCCO 10_0798]MDX8055910.1 neutral zinc metallopeptidase [Lentzea sp. BCCO 10_0798]